MTLYRLTTDFLMLLRLGNSFSTTDAMQHILRPTRTIEPLNRIKRCRDCRFPLDSRYASVVAPEPSYSMTFSSPYPAQIHADPPGQARRILAKMTLSEKIGQISQVNCDYHDLHNAIRAGGIGSVINEVNVDTVNELQRIAVQETRLGIPLLIGRDVIHGFRTIFPIPLGQAASWNPDLVRQGARIAALEAATAGVNWTFAPMIDITRDPRWGRIAESLGEDPYLCSELGAAMIEGFQGEHLEAPGAIAACAKHFAGYGAVEGGLDYNNANIPENELRNVYLRPFKAAVDAGVITFMAGV